MEFKNKLRKGLISLALVGSLVTLSPLSSFAAQGGWSEGEGYWQENDYSNTLSIMAASSKSPDYHKGYTEYGSPKSTYVPARVVGETGWKGKYHYTRARFEWYITGAVALDSDRVWGWDYTIAKTGYTDPAFYHARTYWGT
jgi:hypothetical protein